jgi:hypothetical protein
MAIMASQWRITVLDGDDEEEEFSQPEQEGPLWTLAFG